MNPYQRMDSKYVFGNMTNCGTWIWIPVVQGSALKREDGHGGFFQWIDDRRSSNRNVLDDWGKWRRGEPNGFRLEQCVVEDTKREAWFDVGCESTFCSVCKIPEVQTYHLRGQNVFDDTYFLLLENQESNATVTFDGWRSQIIWNPLEEKTTLTDKRYDFTYIFNQNPFGLLDLKESITQIGGVSGQMTFTNVRHQANIFL